MAENEPGEVSATSNDPKRQLRDDPRFSPGAGCIIIILALSLFTGAISYALWAGIRQDRDIAKFTTDERLVLPDEPGTPAQVDAVRAKLEHFKATIRASQAATLTITTDELNILVRNETALIEIRDMIYFDTITPEAIAGRVSMPLNRLAFWKPRRYLNGTFTMFVESAPGQLFLRLKELKVPGKEIPPGFIERIAQDDLLDPYKNEDNEDIYLSIQSATMGDGSVTIVSNPVERKSAK